MSVKAPRRKPPLKGRAPPKSKAPAKIPARPKAAPRDAGPRPRRASAPRPRRKGRRNGWGRPRVWLAYGFLLGVAGAALLGNAPAWLAGLYWGVSAVTWYCYVLDKRAAQRGGWRIPEARLHLLGLAGGWPGGLLARELQRHKTQKQPFRAIFWLTVLVNTALAGWLLHGSVPPLLSLSF